MKKYCKQLVRSTTLFLLFGFCVFQSIGQGVNDNAGNTAFGNNNLYYQNKYNTGVYTNAEYGDQYISYNEFYEALAPYGQWIEEPRLGYVWSPNVDNTFRPYYTEGHWAMTDYGNTWVSEYQWGWAAFHYGRWTFDPYYGWLWVPGTNWGPAWVSWRAGNGYFGWAPLTPEYQFNENPMNVYECPQDWWVFLPPQYLYSGNYYRYYYGPGGNSTIIKGSKFSNNTYTANNVVFVSGPTPKQVEGITHQPVPMYKLYNSGSARAASVNKDVIKMFRPTEVRQTPVSGEMPMPATVVAAPRRVNDKPQALSTYNSTVAPFKKDIPSNPSPVSVVVPKHVENHAAPKENTSNPAKTGEIQRADNYRYQTTVKTVDPQHPRQEPITIGKPRLTLPNQNPQNPEPVYVKPRKEEALPPPAQHADPVKANPSPERPKPQAVPDQHSDPIQHTAK